MASITILSRDDARRVQDHINQCEKELSLHRYNENPNLLKAVNELMLATHILLNAIPIDRSEDY